MILLQILLAVIVFYIIGGILSLITFFLTSKEVKFNLISDSNNISLLLSLFFFSWYSFIGILLFNYFYKR